MTAAAIALLVALTAPAPAEDWFLFSFGSGQAHGGDRDSIRVDGARRTFRAFSLDGEGYGLATIQLDCEAGTLQITPDGAAALPAAPPVGSEKSMLTRICAYPEGFDLARPGKTLEEMLVVAGEMMNAPPPPFRCREDPPFYTRTETECRRRPAN